MDNEIKGILDYFRKYSTIRENTMITEIKDYITNLEEEIKSKNNEIDVLKDQVEWWKQQCDDLEMQIGESNG